VVSVYTFEREKVYIMAIKDDENKVFVGNLSFRVSEDEVREFFATCGEVSECVIPLSKEDNRPRGFAFVTYANAESADKAIKELDGQEFSGRAIKVNKAQSKSSGGGGRDGGGRGGRGGGDRHRSGDRDRY
jgi:RNA recognition motif-containing protein